MREDDIERELDAALARYAAVQPREGLEQRVLASLRAQLRRVRRRKWRAIGLGASAAVVILGVVMVWHASIKPSETAVVAPSEHAVPSVRDQTMDNALHITTAHGGEGASVRTRVVSEHARAADRVVPKLARFPAPEPLTEQERLLIQFVQQDPQEAKLVAEAQVEALQREADEMKALNSNMDSQPQEQ